MFNLKNGLILISYAAGLFFLFTNGTFLLGLIGQFSEMLAPFTYGFAIAYLLNKPYSKLRKAISKISFRNKPISEKVVKLLSISTTYLVFVGLITYFAWTIIPQIYKSSSRLANYLDDLTTSDGQNSASHLLRKAGIDSSVESKLLEILIKFTGNLEEFSQKLIVSAYDVITKFIIEAYYWALGLIVSVYLISGKEKLLRQAREIKDAFIPKKISIFMTEVLRLSDQKIGKFLTGNILKSILIGFLCFLGTSILGTPYGILISILVSITNLVPFFGPIFGSILGSAIVFTIDPVKSLWFAIFILVLQQIDANILGPRILGNATGLSGFWIMFSIILFGKFFGVIGMILGAPIFAIFYVLLGRSVKKRLYGKVYVKKEEEKTE